MLVQVVSNFGAQIETTEFARELARLPTQVSIHDANMLSCVTTNHRACPPLASALLTEITLMDANVIGSAVVRAIVKAALNTQQLATGTLQSAKLDVAPQINRGILKRSTQFLDASVSRLETGQVLCKPFVHMVDAQVDDLFKVLRKTICPFMVRKVLSHFMLIPGFTQSRECLFASV